MGGDWAWHVGAAAIGALAVAVFVWAWWGDRSRGRARCGRCWYSMDGLQETERPVCPECGWVARRRSWLFRARRRRWWALLALVLAVTAAAAGLAPKVRRDGAWSLAPTWALWGVLRTGHVPGDAFARELAGRPEGYDQLAAAADRVYRWAPSVRLTRERGVKGLPVRALPASVLGSGSQIRGGMLFTPSGWGLNDADVDSVQSHENWWTSGTRIARPSKVSPPEPGVLVTTLVVRSLVARSLEGMAYIEARVPLADSIDDVMTPMPIAAERVAAALRPSLFVLPTTRCLALSVRDVSEADVGASVALGMRVEIVRRGEVIARGRWYQGTGEASVSGRPVLVRFGPYDPVGNQNGPMTVSLEELLAEVDCVVRFTTDEEMALAAIGYGSYWRGSFERPLKELVGR